MPETSPEKTPHDASSSKKESSFSTEEAYSEDAVWLCKNRKTGYKTRIHGALAQILRKYPKDYKLRLLSIKETRHEHPPATGQ